mgnify:FL=1
MSETEQNIHQKIWGNERWLVNTKDYCGKILTVNKGYRSSIRYHRKKDETFYLLSGRILIETGGKERIMQEEDVQRILPLTEHRFTGLEKSVIIEFSTHHEEEDSYRTTLSEKIPEEEFKELLKRLGI